MALHCMTPPLRVGMVDRLSPIDRNLVATATSETKKAEQTKDADADADAYASGGAIGDNGSTL